MPISEKRSLTWSELIMKTRTYQTYECKIFLGSVNEDTKLEFDEAELRSSIEKFQDQRKPLIPVRITKTQFICGSSYREDGWEIGIINYPKLEINIEQLEFFCEELSEHLLYNLHQNRVSLMTPYVTTMYHDRSRFPQSVNSKVASP